MNDDEQDLATQTFNTETKYNMETGLPLVKFVRLGGLLQSPPDGSPSYTLYDEQGRIKLMKWHDQDQLHREGAGATIHVDPETKVHTFEVFYTDGHPRKRDIGPFRILRDRASGEITREQFLGDPDFPNKAKPPSPS